MHVNGARFRESAGLQTTQTRQKNMKKEPSRKLIRICKWTERGFEGAQVCGHPGGERVDSIAPSGGLGKPLYCPHVAGGRRIYDGTLAHRNLIEAACAQNIPRI